MIYQILPTAQCRFEFKWMVLDIQLPERSKCGSEILCFPYNLTSVLEEKVIFDQWSSGAGFLLEWLYDRS